MLRSHRRLGQGMDRIATIGGEQGEGGGRLTGAEGGWEGLQGRGGGLIRICCLVAPSHSDHQQ